MLFTPTTRIGKIGISQLLARQPSTSKMILTTFSGRQGPGEEVKKGVNCKVITIDASNSDRNISSQSSYRMQGSCSRVSGVHSHDNTCREHPDEKVEEDTVLAITNSVLIVDDMATNRTMLRRLLRDRCHAVEEAEDGLDAVNKIQQALESGKIYDLITMDYQMPNMDGKKFDIYRHIAYLYYAFLFDFIRGGVLPLFIMAVVLDYFDVF